MGEKEDIDIVGQENKVTIISFNLRPASEKYLRWLVFVIGVIISIVYNPALLLDRVAGLICHVNISDRCFTFIEKPKWILTMGNISTFVGIFGLFAGFCTPLIGGLGKRHM